METRATESVVCAGVNGTRARLDVLALFPSFAAEPFGGVQVSGREALLAIANAGEAEEFYYDPRNSRAANVIAALRRRRHVETLFVWHSHLLRLAPFIASSSRRIVVFLHGIEAWRKQDRLSARLMRRTDLFLSNSEYTWHRFLASNPEFADRPHRTVNLGLGEPAQHVLPPACPPSAVMIGRLRKEEDYKGHREMVALWPRVCAVIPDAQLHIVGDGDLRPDLERMVRDAGMEDHTHFHGSVPDWRKCELLVQSRAMFLPSRAEGFGLVYLEAMRLGRPSLVSHCDAGREVINPPEAGLAVDIGDREQTLDGMVRLLTAGPDWDAMSVRACRRFGRLFTAEAFRERLQLALLEN